MQIAFNAEIFIDRFTAWMRAGSRGSKAAAERQGSLQSRRFKFIAGCNSDATRPSTPEDSGLECNPKNQTRQLARFLRKNHPKKDAEAKC